MQMSRVSHGTGLLITFQFVEFIMESVNAQPPGAETNNFFYSSLQPRDGVSVE